MTGFCQAFQIGRRKLELFFPFIGVEMGTFLSLAEELWQEPKDSWNLIFMRD